ncbi:MAG: hypothetical protein ACJAUZ_002035 [Flavobacteriaceae bacterium]|jgi:hypothetical protein
MCVPARAAIACGDHVHNIKHWDSVTPYDGSVLSWMKQLREAGIVFLQLASCTFAQVMTTMDSLKRYFPCMLLSVLAGPSVF